MSQFITKDKRTHYCGNVSVADVGSDVILFGWAQRRRDHGGVIFIDLRDREGIVQIVFNPEAGETVHGEAHKIRSEYVLAVRGKVRRRPEGMENPAIPTGQIEVMISDLEILNESKTPPFSFDEEDIS